MIKEYNYTPSGVCSRQMKFTYDDETMKIVKFEVIGGCNGNLQGIQHLIEGMDIKTVVEKLDGIKCGYKKTSCPDQISKGLAALIK